jgi:DNA-binding transcriptional LysR family regulator
MQTIEKFRREFSEVDVITRHSYKNDEEFDLIISNDDIPLLGFVGEKILTEEILLALRVDHPLASVPEISVEDLRAQNFISMGENSNIYKAAAHICREMGFEPHNVILADDPFYVRRCVELGLGIAFVPSLSWRGQFSEDIVLRNFGPFYRDTFVFKNQRKAYSKTFERFLSLLLEEFNSECPTTKQISLQNSVE